MNRRNAPCAPLWPRPQGAQRTLGAIEPHVKGPAPGNKCLPTLLQTLEALGRAQGVATGGEVAWRG
ncbi:hypothetical protein CBP36_10245 [Acidovorax carolinensis]|uniref:Uncharacterized protein n=1 Tax=Acidovorax carolinensis TaxID=553814 RepID=A0A240UDK6_9BURK|nr:hypothetical protein CBP35_08680 [Acidovorax carolinensis]ART59175.1 hypothetical protein CBP36_10245 [Acidovorax carolinensis]